MVDRRVDDCGPPDRRNGGNRRASGWVEPFVVEGSEASIAAVESDRTTYIVSDERPRVEGPLQGIP